MHCRVCNKTHLEPVINLGNQPWCNHFLKKEECGTEPVYPLQVVYCHDCQTAQLNHTVAKEVMFGDHTYLSGITKSLSEHFRQVAQEVDAAFLSERTDKSVLDIGSNDGTQLKHFQALGYEVLGVESSKTTARIANEAGVPTLNTFFNLETVQKLDRQFNLINAAGVFFHLEELHSVAEGIRVGLKPDGVFVVQFLYMKSIMENVAFDQIYHEHLLYYNLKTVNVLLNLHGMELFDARLSPIHGGSIIAYAGHTGKRPASAKLQAMVAAEAQAGSNTIEAYRNFAQHIEQMKAENLAYLGKAKAAGKSIWGFGAPVKGNTLLNYFGIGTQYLDCLVERNTLRKNLYSPGQHIPVVIEEELTTLPDIYYVLAWNFKEEILKRNQALIAQGVEFYFPVNPK
jgi:SAM-dependent methyltransferase